MISPESGPISFVDAAHTEEQCLVTGAANVPGRICQQITDFYPFRSFGLQFLGAFREVAFSGPGGLPNTEIPHEKGIHV